MSEWGISAFNVTPGTVDTIRCSACGAVCDVQRDVDGYTSYAAAVARRTSRVDKFRCPHADTDWHRLAVRLVKAIAETPSRRLAALMHQDLEDVLLGCGVEGVSTPAQRNE